MTEPMESPAQPAEAAPRRRGRPRPESVKAQDAQVYAALATPKTRQQLVEETGLEPNKVYLSLWRLRHDNHVAKGRGDNSQHTWSRAEGAPEAYPVASAPTA